MTETDPVSMEREPLDPAVKAKQCASYRADPEEEWADEEPVSCLNCFFRRWTPESYQCMALTGDLPSGDRKDG